MICTAHYEYRTDVAYSDLGPNGRISHAGMLRILQEAASVASDDVGYGLKDIPRTGVHWILTAWRLELKRRSVWRAKIRVETWPRNVDGYVSDRSFLVWEGDSPVAEASSRWILVSAETGRPVRVSGTERIAYQDHLDSQEVFGGAPLPRSGSTPDGAPVTFRTTVGRRDIDTNLHVNNIHYPDYAIEALPEEVYRNLPNTVEIAFKRQLLLGTPIQCLYSLTENGKHQIEVRSGEGEKITHHAFIWFYDNKKEVTAQ